MLLKLFAIFVLLPLAELAILIRLGQAIGVWSTLAIVVASGAIGALLAAREGGRVLGAIQAELAVGRAPTARLVDGFLIFLGGLLLLIPGLITDLMGFLLLLPFTRARLKTRIRGRFERMAKSGQVSMITLIR